MNKEILGGTQREALRMAACPKIDLPNLTSNLCTVPPSKLAAQISGQIGAAIQDAKRR